ncbi:Ig-like domain-containing protein [Sphingobacterium sp. IITKGP-BTPF85]|nr:Ig-like domain-containing protein [Sphingobacterium sp. IITKGP-BTPF85]KKX50875.1 hypothetical protein L950_0208065 [Sphingobacterium sp. IITKGP-BTPF85]
MKINAITILLLCSGGFIVQATAFPRIGNTLMRYKYQKKTPIRVLDEYGKPVEGAKVYSIQQQLLGNTDEEGRVQISVTDTTMEV